MKSKGPDVRPVPSASLEGALSISVDWNGQRVRAARVASTRPRGVAQVLIGKRAAEAVAHSAMSAIGKFAVSDNAAVLGIGGPHYNRRFTRMALNDKAIFSHIIAKYAIPLVDTRILRQCEDKTLERVDSAILDWKGIKSADKPKLMKALEETELPYRKI